MTTNMSTGNERGPESGQVNVYPPANQTPHYRFNLEELRVLRQCNRESFYQRSLPISTVLCIGTYYAVKSGYIRGNPTYGAFPKMVVAGIVGYFVGKFSYQSKCAEKLMQLPNSPIGEMLRQRKQQGMRQETLSDPGSYSWPAPGTPTTETIVEPVRELDERPMHEGFENYPRPSFDSPLVEEEELPPAQNYTTYDELRRKNREEYETKRSKLGYGRIVPSDVPATSVQFGSEQSKKTEAKNKYGDVWEE